MNKNPVLRCTDLGTMDNLYTSPKRSQPEPPEGFIDNTVKVFRLNPDGSKGELVRTMEAFPPGWSDPQKLREKGFQKQSKEDEAVVKPLENREELIRRAKALMRDGLSLTKAAKEVGMSSSALSVWLKKERQAANPEPTQAANQEPEREEAEPATQSVAQEEPETYDEICPPQDTTLDEMKLIWIEDVMEHCVTVEIKMRYIEAIAGLRV